MKRTWRTTILSVGVAVLWTSVATGMQGYSGSRGGFGSGLGKGWVQLRGHVLCADCTLADLRATAPAPRSRVFQLNHSRGQVVMQVNREDASLRYHNLWLKGGDQVFETLAAEENLFKQIAVSGLLREYLPTAGTLDLATVTIIGDEQSVKRDRDRSPL